MSRRIAALMVIGMTFGIASAYAQEERGPGVVEVTYMPAGAGYFTAKDNSPSFGNYGFGTAAAFRINRVLGVEGELAAMLATDSGLQFGDLPSNVKAPNVLSYTANLVVSPWAGHAFQPYAAGGVGGLTMFSRTPILPDDETFLSGNVGGGVKWYAANNRWGLRGDYRFGATKSKDDAEAFFGRDTRYIHRVYAGVIINTKR